MLNTLVFALALILSPAEWVTYTDTSDLYSIKYPGFWEQTVKDDSVALLSKMEGASDGFRENVNVSVKDLSKAPMTMAEHSLAMKEWLTRSGGKMQFERVIQFAGYTASKLVYTLPRGAMGVDKELMIQQVWFIKGSRSYMLTFAAESGKYEKYEQVANIIFQSFTLK